MTTAPFTPVCVAETAALCGESPVWDSRHGVLRWVDITREAVHAFDPATGTNSTVQLPCLVSAVLLLEGSDALIVATARGLARFDPASGALDVLHDPEPDRPGNRLNDCKADPQGRLFAGSMSEGAKGPTGGLWRYDGAAKRLVSDLIISNGLGWSPDARRFYLVDSAKGEINLFDHDPKSGALENRAVLASYAADEGKPDGLCVDQAGNLWVAFWDGARVECLSPEGEVLRRVALPVKRPTSCCFGGDDLKRLYITSAAVGIDAPDLDGGVFAMDVEVPGLPSTPVSVRAIPALTDH